MRGGPSQRERLRGARRRNHEPGCVSDDEVAVRTEQDLNASGDDLGRYQVNCKVAVDNEEQLDDLRIVGNQQGVVPLRIGSPAYLDQPAVFALERGRLYLNTLKAIRHIDQQIVVIRLRWEGNLASAEPGSGRRERFCRAPQVCEIGLELARIGFMERRASQMGGVETKTERMCPNQSAFATNLRS